MSTENPTYLDRAKEAAREAKELLEDATQTTPITLAVEHAVDRILAALNASPETQETCERCKGSGTELYQGCGEWLSEECPSCGGSGFASPSHPETQEGDSGQGEDGWHEVWVWRDPITRKLHGTLGTSELTSIPPVGGSTSPACRRYVPSPGGEDR